MEETVNKTKPVFNWERAINSYKIDTGYNGGYFVEKVTASKWLCRYQESYLNKKTGNFDHRSDIPAYPYSVYSDPESDYIFNTKEEAYDCYKKDK